MASMALSLAMPAVTDGLVASGDVPANALLDENGTAILDENGNYILTE